MVIKICVVLTGFKGCPSNLTIVSSGAGIPVAAQFISTGWFSVTSKYGCDTATLGLSSSRTKKLMAFEFAYTGIVNCKSLNVKA